MKHREPLTDRLITRILENPRVFDMRYFSAITQEGITYCLAGLILLEDNVLLEYDKRGIAVGLAKGQQPPTPEWTEYELKQVKGAAPGDVIIQAKAREIWAREHGIEAAEILPLYAEDWEANASFASLEERERALLEITPAKVVGYLRCIRQGAHLKAPRGKLAKRANLRAVA